MDYLLSVQTEKRAEHRFDSEIGKDTAKTITIQDDGFAHLLTSAKHTDSDHTSTELCNPQK